MDLFPTLYIIGYYSTKALQGSQFSPFCNIIPGINENKIPSYNDSRRELLEERKIRVER